MARKITIKELTEIIKKELGAEVDPSKMKVKTEPWHDAEPENEIDWLKSLKIKELFARSLKAKNNG